MSVRPYRDIQRRKSRQIRVGSVLVGGDAPITVQTMTNTLTPDVAATVAQIKAAEAAGNHCRQFRPIHASDSGACVLQYRHV